MRQVHAGTLLLPVGTLVEVESGEDDPWYGEINGYEGIEPLVTYLVADEDNIHTFDADTYEAPKESINRFVRLEKGRRARLIASSVSFTSTDTRSCRSTI